MKIPGRNRTGQIIHNLTVLEYYEPRLKGKKAWVCKCICGKIKVIPCDYLERVKSCGCKKNLGHTKHPLWSVYLSMRIRCKCTTSKHYKRYGARGIKLSKEWDESFEQFVADIGPRPSLRHSLDRIDNDGDYCKLNCRWATPEQQANNRRGNRFITYAGTTHTLAQWCRKLSVTRRRVEGRINKLGDSAAIEELISRDVK